MNRKTIPQDTIVVFGGVGFTLLMTWLIWAMAPLLKDVPHLADSGASWYWWQLPERTTMGIFSAWFFYALYQLTMWGLIFYAQRSQPKYGHTLHEINWWALGLNGSFCL